MRPSEPTLWSPPELHLGRCTVVPISIKSCIDVAGMRCEAGSRLRKGNVPSTDATLVARLKAAGAIVLGVTNTPEFLMAWETDNALYGRTNNPWDLARTAGGSSGGESAAIAVVHVRRRGWQRRWRIYPRSCTLHRDLWPEAYAWPCSGNRAFPPGRGGSSRGSAQRADGSHRRRFASALPSDGRRRSCRCGISSGSVGRDTSD